jgi:hypothetical protein
MRWGLDDCRWPIVVGRWPHSLSEETRVEELRLGDQMARYDRNATAAAYALVPSGGADRCGCVHCRNFAAQRDKLYPHEFRALLTLLGIDPSKEGEVYDKVGPFDLRLRPIGGWFYFVGQLIKPGQKSIKDGISNIGFNLLFLDLLPASARASPRSSFPQRFPKSWRKTRVSWGTSVRSLFVARERVHRQDLAQF